jgi:hypothetical protein
MDSDVGLKFVVTRGGNVCIHQIKLDNSDNEWNNHLCRGRALFFPFPIDENVWLQMMLHIVNAIHVDVVSPPQKPHGPPPGKQPNLLDMLENCEDA